MIEIVNEDYTLDSQFYLEKLEAIVKELNITGDIVIKLGDKDEARQLNLQYRQKDYPTDVLSFPSNEELPEGYYLGDIFICHPLAEDQAKENDISLEEELLTLMVHGVRHLAGYDHETDDGEMEQLQERLLVLYFSHEGHEEGTKKTNAPQTP
jgi:probable rRNA maturation factor